MGSEEGRLLTGGAFDTLVGMATKKRTSKKPALRPFVVSGDVTFAFVVQVMAENADEAAEIAGAMEPSRLDYNDSDAFVDVQDVHRDE